MATCPGCGLKTAFELEPVLEVLGPAYVAGVQPKLAARSAGRLTCAPARGGCGFTVVGRVEGGYLLVDEPDG